MTRDKKTADGLAMAGLALYLDNNVDDEKAELSDESRREFHNYIWSFRFRGIMATTAQNQVI